MPKLQSVTTYFALNASNDASPSGVVDQVTNQPVFVPDLDLGVYFDLTEAEANSLSQTSVGTLHSGRYRRVKVDSGATAANIKTGTIGLLAVPGSPLSMNVVTSYDIGDIGVRPVVFLNAITPGNYGFIQELGVATVLYGASFTKSPAAKGDFIDSATGGVATDLTGQAVAKTSLGIAMDVPQVNLKGKIILNLPEIQD